MLITCSFDYLTDTFSNKSFVVYLTVVDFVIPMFPLFTLYFLIAKEVIGYYRKQKAVMSNLGMPKHVIKRVRSERAGNCRDVTVLGS